MRLSRCLARFAIALLQLVLAVSASLAGGTMPDIEVTGLRTISADSVRAYLAFSGGDADDPRMIDASLKTLMATGLFADVRIERQATGQSGTGPRGTGLVVTVVENPMVATVTIEGQSAIEKKPIEAELKLKPRERFTQARLRADVLRIRDLYRRLGRLATTITPSATPRTDGRVDIVIAIKEAAVSRIDGIAFAGARAFSERQLCDVISTAQSGWLDILKTAAFYDPERIENDRQLLQRHYLTHGFPEARVTGVAADLNAQGTGYLVTFTVEEGERHVFGAARIETKLAGVDTRALESLAKVKPAGVYDRERIDKSVEAMSEALAKQGHPFARVQAVVHTDHAARRVDIEFRVEAGKPRYLERIDIVGNDHTKDHVIRRELRLAEGDPANAFLIERARTRVRALGFFKSVDVKMQPGSASDRVRLTIVVVEQETGEFGFGVGYSTTEGVIGDIAWTERNLFGNGQTLRFKVAGSATRLQADIGFTEPHLLGSPVAGGFDLFYKDVDYTKLASYMSRKVGGDLRLGLPWSDEFSTSVNYTFVRSTLYNVGPNASAAIREAVPGLPGAGGFPGNGSAAYNTSSVGTGAAFDTRDNKNRPTSGVYITTAQDLAGVGGDVRFLRSVADARAYHPVSDSVTLFGRATGGVITGWGGQDVRLLDLFTKGGETVRGFAPAGFGPRDLASANHDALGGRMFAATTAEAQFDLPGVPKDFGLRGAVFADAGSLWGVNRTAAALPGLAGSTPTLRASAGVGLTWDSPLGPLRADYAIPLAKQAYDKTQPFSFGMAPF